MKHNRQTNTPARKIIIPVIILMIAAVLVYFISQSRSFQFFGGIVNHVNTTDKYVALTFDDGPTMNTDSVLTVLNKHHIRASFFVTGQDLEKYPGEARKLVLAGNELGNHSFSHQRMILKPYRFIRSEIDRTDSLIRVAGYTGNISFRPPYGKKLLLLPYYLKTKHKKTILWDIEPESFPDITIDQYPEYISANARPGSIILLHVMYDRTGRKIQILENIIKSLKEKGFEFRTVSELLKSNMRNQSS